MEEAIMEYIPLIRSIFQGTILGFTLIATYFLSKDTKNLSAEDILKLSRPVCGRNMNIINNLSQQKAQTMVGFQSMVIALVLQMTILLLPVTLSSLGNVDPKGIITGFVFTALFFFWFRNRCRTFESDIQTKIQQILKEEKHRKDTRKGEIADPGGK